MALLDRVKERIESELSDEELQRLIDEANSEIVKRYGEHAPAEVTERFAAGMSRLFPSRQVDEVADIAIDETIGDTTTTLDEDDYRVWHGGRMIQRLDTGPNPGTSWGEALLTYTPVDDGNQRQEVIIKLVQLSISYEGISKDSIDGYSTTFVDYTTERNRILAELGPKVLMA